MSPAKRTRVSGDKDYHPLLELTEARGREIWEFLAAHPSHSEVVTDLWYPWVGMTKVSK